MISELFSATVLIGILTSGIRLATPYLYAAIGETFGQRSGVLNLGVEGQMLLAAFAAFYVALSTGNLWLGLLAAILVGALHGPGHGLRHRESAGAAGRQRHRVLPLWSGDERSALSEAARHGSRRSPVSDECHCPSWAPFPVVGEIFFDQNVLVYGAYLLVPLAWFVLNKTTLGLKIRAVGENPEAADSLGVSVARVRYFTIILGGALSGMAGASLSIALLNVFQQNMTSGLGFIAVALVYFGAWRPWGVLAGALLFSMVNALQLWIQVLAIPIPSDIAVMMPYVLTIVVLIVSVSRVRAPSALTRPFEREE